MPGTEVNVEREGVYFPSQRPLTAINGRFSIEMGSGGGGFINRLAKRELGTKCFYLLLHLLPTTPFTPSPPLRLSIYIFLLPLLSLLYLH